MAESFHRLTTALWETIVFCGPMWFVFVAIVIAICGRFCLLTFRDEKEERLAEDVRRRSARPRRDDTSTTPNTPPRELGVFDQDQLPAWMPVVPESRLRLLRYDRRQRAAARRSLA